MTSRSIKFLLKPLSIAVCSAVALFAALPVVAQAPATPSLQPRIAAQIDNSSRATLTGSRPPLADPAYDAGAVSPTMKLQGMSILFSRSAAQQTALDALVAAQQNPASPLYHQWLTPDQFAAQFGVADADLAAVKTWLEQQGFSVDSVSRSHNRIFFSGNAGQVASAFGASLHYYNLPAVGNQPATTHFAPSADLTVPAALGSSVLAVTNLDDFRFQPHLNLRGPAGAQPRFTSSETGNHYLTPGDVATIYNITPAYDAGFIGSNQSIAIVGQSEVKLSDIANFQTAVGIAGKTPIPVIVPGSGTPEIYADGDEAESDLDLEYSSTIAKGAQVYFVYTGNSNNYGVFNSIEYAIDERIAPIISSSYGECEPSLGQSGYTQYNSYLEQAAAQGQTVVAAAGDDGSTDCYGEYSSRNTSENEQLAVDFPGSSQYVTAMGGSEFPAADVASGNNTYFQAESTTDIISSALSYIPEGVWNDDTTFGSSDPSDPLGAGGGGVSIYTPQPSWQSGTIGGVAIATGGKRMVPDISLTASPVNAPFAFCTSDETFWSSGQEASCNDGLRDSATGFLTVGGGTSFDAPTFSGLVAIINQSQNSTGQGVVNTTLYALAATSVYATAFHDITSGGNQCTAGSAYCSAAGESKYAAATGYDEASGLGSIDFYNLLTSWPNYSATSSLAATTTTLTAATDTPVAGAADAVTITVAPLITNAITPTGTVSLTVDGGAPTSIPLTAGVATYSFESSTAGSHILVATYSGDTSYSTSTGTLTLTVGETTTATGSFTLSATNATVADGSSGTSTVTVTPSGGYMGTITWAAQASPAISVGCYDIANLPITSSAAVTTTLTIYTTEALCETTATRPLAVRHYFAATAATKIAALNTNSAPAKFPWKRIPLRAAFAGTLMLICFRRRSRLLRAGLSLGILALISVAGLGLTACGSSNSSTTTTTTSTTVGTYTITLTGSDTNTPTITNSTTFTLTVTD